MSTGITPPQVRKSEAYGCVWGTDSATVCGGLQPEMLMPGSQQGKLNKAIDVYRCACALTCMGSKSVCGSCAMCQTGDLCTLVPATPGLAILATGCACESSADTEHVDVHTGRWLKQCWGLPASP